MSTVPAPAADGGPGSDELTGPYVYPTEVGPGQTTKVSGDGCRGPGPTVSITIGGRDAILTASGTADVRGSWAVPIAVPATARPDVYDVKVTCVRSPGAPAERYDTGYLSVKASAGR